MPYAVSKDPYAGMSSSTSSSARQLKPATKHDSNDLDTYAKALLCTVAGDVKILPVGNDDADSVTIPVSAGQILPVQVRRVWNTGTTATVFLVMG